MVSATQISGGVAAVVQLNRISFEDDGQKYVIVAGMPVSRAEKLWVLREATYKPGPNREPGPSIGAGPLAKMLQETREPGRRE